MSRSPTVLHPLTLPGLLDYILATQSGTAPTLLVVCSSRGAFLEDLLEALQHEQTEHRTSRIDDLLTPTLFNLFTTQHVKLAFCPSVQTLLAYLTACGRPRTEPVGGPEGRERLVLVNPLAMHAPSTSFSAQGLSRTFAAATEAALSSGALLNIVECQGKQRRHEEHGDGHEDADMDAGDEQGRAEAEAKDPWDQDVPILNVSARRYGSGSSDRAWAGRTVTARRVAGRWFRFHKMDDEQTCGTIGRES
ncbi:hypothetical protein T440DRAFT_495557 [Plenodomus tracheiphilus IPT5]|uniref:Elongator complex protein 5 n=1 Tax=Plenodomus tracheiphilus IPT5 TaxID=1408161 RepID=A0A6A7BM24_9PLEO|nr:hypothetical protein T440DRAFT_495557 [Plenodomus tracheiphilus IPT5]